MAIVLDPTIGITNVNGTAAAPALTGTDTNTGVFFPAADTIAFAEGGTESMRLDSNGNVGIGTTSPGGSSTDRQFSVVGSSSSQITVSSGAVVTNFGSTSSIGYIQTIGAYPITFNNNGAERMRIDSSGSLLVGPSSTGTYPYNAVNAVNYKRQLTSGTAQSVFTFAKTNTTASSGFRTSFMGTLYVAFTGRTSGGTTSAYGFTANVNIASTAGSTITLAASAVSALNAVSSGLTVSCAVSLTSASATSANLSVTITQTAGTLQDNELTVSLIGANSSTDSTSFFTVTPA